MACKEASRNETQRRNVSRQTRRAILVVANDHPVATLTNSRQATAESGVQPFTIQIACDEDELVPARFLRVPLRGQSSLLTRSEAPRRSGGWFRRCPERFETQVHTPIPSLLSIHPNVSVVIADVRFPPVPAILVTWHIAPAESMRRQRHVDSPVRDPGMVCQE